MPATVPGLSDKRLGSKGGNETTTLTVANMPAHNHSVRVRGEISQADLSNPTDAMFAAPQTPIFAADTAANEVLMNARALQEQTVGRNQSFANEQPYQVVNYIVVREFLPRHCNQDSI